MATNHIKSVMFIVTVLGNMHKVATDSGKKGNTIETQALGRPFGLGMLYNYPDDTLVPGITLWNRDRLTEDQTVTTNPSINTKVTTSDKLSDRAQLLNIDTNLKMSFLAGLVKVKGSAKYLDEKKSYNHQARVSLNYQCTTVFQQLSMNTLAYDNIDHRELLDRHEATHVVTGIQYGANVILSFELLNYNNNEDSNRNVKGAVEVLVKSIPDFNIEGNATVYLNEQDKKLSTSLSVNFHGDIRPKYNPSSFKEAIQVYKDLNELVGEKGVPLTVYLLPLENLDIMSGKLARELSATLMIKVTEIFENFQDIFLRCNSLQKIDFFPYIFTFSKKLKKFESYVEQEQIIFQKKLSPILPRIRGGDEDESNLTDIIHELITSPFSYEKLNNWVKERESELKFIDMYYKFMKGIEFISSLDLNVAIYNPEYKHTLCFVLKIPDMDKQLSAMEHYSDQRESVSEIQETVDEDELKQNQTVHQIANQFKAFFNANKMNTEMNTAFFLSEVRTDSQYVSASIYYYKAGELISENFMPPSAPESLTFANLSGNSVFLKWKPSTLGAKILKYEISYKVFPDGIDNSKVIDGSSTELLLVSLEYGTPYKIRCRGVVPTGVTPYTEIPDVVLTLPKISDVTSESHAMVAAFTGSLKVNKTIKIGCPEGRYSCYKLPGCPPGFFRGPVTDQCFRRMDDTTRTWDDAKENCTAEGLVMAKPYDAVSLQNYLLERFGDGGYWLGARGGAANQTVWTRDHVAITASDPLWFPGYPGSATSHSHCLVMDAYANTRKSHPGKPLFTNSCSYSYRTLCELVME